MRVTVREAAVITGNSGLTTVSRGGGAGGNVELRAQDIRLSDGSFLSAESSGESNAGTLAITATDTFLSTHSAITTAAEAAGGGDIALEARVVRLTDSALTAEARGVEQQGSDGGNVTIRAAFVILNGSQVQANAFGGNGGNITITAADAFLADAATCAQQACLNASSQLGVAGTVAVNTPTADLSGVVTPLAQTFAYATVLLPHRCAERLREQPVSTFVLAGRDGLPVQPGSVLPSPLLAEQRGGTPPPAARVWQTPALADGQRGRHAPGRPQGLGWQGQATSPRGLDLPCPQGRSEPAGPSVLHK